MVKINKIKIAVIYILMLVCDTSCALFVGVDIKSYKYSPELVIYAEECMNKLFDKYPETHITNEILSDYKNAYLYHYPYHYQKIDSLFPSHITKEFVRDFFGKMEKYEELNAFGTQRQRGFYRIISKNKNIHGILIGLYTSYGTPLIILRDVSFADKKYIEFYPYKQDYPKVRLREAKEDFETDILPKILECFEIVKKKHDQNEK